MPNTAEYGKVEFESGQTLVTYVALTDDGDQTKFNSAATIWSDKSGYSPSIRPNGLITGGAITPAATGTSNYVDTAAITCYLAGVATSVAASVDNDCPRPDTTYLVLTLAASGYTNCVASDIGKTVTGGTTGDTGTLIAYNNTTRQWVVDQTDSGDVFDDDDEALTIGSGTGAGDMSAVAAACTHQINSITVTSAGAIAVVQGQEGTSFSTTRGDIGGPPFIPTTSIEVGQVRYTASAAAAVASTEIFQVIGTHKEMYNYPLWSVRYGEVSNGALGYAGVDFLAALPAIHTGSLPKRVYAQYYTVSFTEANNASDFKPPEKTHSVSSTQVYNNVINSSSSSLGQGSFTCQLEDGLTDPIVQQKDSKLWFRFYPDRYKSPYQLCQGKLGVGRSNPAGGNITSACTISAATEALDVIA